MQQEVNKMYPYIHVMVVAFKLQLVMKKGEKFLEEQMDILPRFV